MTPKEIPLGQLTRTKKNVRKRKPDELAFEQLSASILAHGVIQSLVVIPTKSQKFAAVAGDRRLQVCQRLLKEGSMTEETMIPCIELPPDADPSEISLAENMVREGLHPLDQMAAFKALFKEGKGLPVEKIAERFGYTPRWVERVLSMARVNPHILKAYEEEKITQDTVMAFTLCDDQQRQLEAYKAVKKSSYGEPSAHEIRRHFTGAKVEANTRLPNFVGLEAYEAAGGTCTIDLFSDEEEGEGVWIDDVELLKRLALEKLEPEAEKRRVQGWKWVSVNVEANYHDETHACDNFDPGKGSRHNKEEMALCGVVIHLDYAGKVGFTRGLVRKEDRAEVRAFIKAKRQEAEEAAEAAEAARAAQAAQAEAEPTEEGAEQEGTEEAAAPVEEPAYRYSHTATEPAVDKTKQAIKDAGLTVALVDDLKVVRGNLARWTLAQNMPVAHNALIYSLTIVAFSQFQEDTACNVSARKSRLDPPAIGGPNDIGQDLFGKMVEDTRKRHCRWILGKDEYDESKSYSEKLVKPRERWELFKAVPVDEKLRVAALVSAMTLHNQLSIENGLIDDIELIIEDIKPDFTKWTPTAENFFGRINKAELLKILADVLDDTFTRDEFGKSLSDFTNWKKGDLAAYMEGIFAPGAKEAGKYALSDGSWKKISEWYPPSFAAKKV